MAEGGQHCYEFWILIAIIAAIVVCKCTSYYFDYQIRKVQEETRAVYYKNYAETMQKYSEALKLQRDTQQEIMKLLQR